MNEQAGLMIGGIAGALGICSLFALGSPVFAQAASASAQDDSTTFASSQLQEVVVTAERRAENIQTTPIAVTALSGEMLQSAKVDSVQNLQTVAPALSITTSGGFSMINIRGIGIENGSNGNTAGVALIHDGLPNQSAGMGDDVPFYDIADVEVLRGPQGTFVGSNSTGGAIQITSANPNFRGVNGYVEAQFGNYDDKLLQGAVNLPISETLAARLAFNTEQKNSFYFDEATALYGPLQGLNPAGGGSSYTAKDPGNLSARDGRFSLLWRPSSNFQALLKLEYDSNPTDGTPDQPDTGTFEPLQGMVCPNGGGPGPCRSAYISGYSGSPFILNDAYTAEEYNETDELFGLQLNYTLADGIVLRSMDGYQENGLGWDHSTTADAINYGFTESYFLDKAYSQEIDVISPTTGPLTWIAGGTWNLHRTFINGYSVNTGPPYSAAKPGIGTNTDFATEFRNEGVFGQVTWTFVPSLQLQVGVRSSWDDDSSSGRSLTYIGTISPQTLNRVLLVGGSPYSWVKDSQPTGKVGLNWTLSADNYFYVFYALGYKPGGTNIAAPPAGKEIVHDYELGWKGTEADGHVKTQLGGYYMGYDGLQEGLFDIYSPSSGAVDNLGKSTVEGIEASMQAGVQRFTTNFSAAYNRSKLGSTVTYAKYAFPVGFGTTPQCAAGEAPGSGNINCTNYLPYQLTLTGESLPFAPEFTASVTAQYAIPIGTAALTPRLIFSYAGKQYSALFQYNDYYELRARQLWNAYLDYTVGAWRVTAYGTNLTNELYASDIGSGNGAVSASPFEVYGDPRQYGLQLERTF